MCEAGRQTRGGDQHGTGFVKLLMAPQSICSCPHEGVRANQPRDQMSRKKKRTAPNEDSG